MSERHTPGPIKPCRSYENYEGRYYEVDPEDEAEYAKEPITKLEAKTRPVASAHDLFTFLEPDARLLCAAYNSYDKHFGERALVAAESDWIGRAIEALRSLLEMGSVSTTDQQIEENNRRRASARALLTEYNTTENP